MVTDRTTRPTGRALRTIALIGIDSRDLAGDDFQFSTVASP